jgi:5-methyltetrahydropteroyltriglutamate--homocysteine methyltransferase
MPTAVSKQFRTDAVGSLIRPRRVLEAQARFRAGRSSASELRQIEDAAILDALERQREIGIDVLTDGEMRRVSWMTGFSDAVNGFAAEYPVAEAVRPDGTTELIERHTKHVVGRLQQRRRLAALEVPFLEQHAQGQRFKVTLPSPNVFGWRSFKPGITDRVYATREALHEEVIGIVQGEMKALVEADHVPYLQLDEGFVRAVARDWMEDEPGRDLTQSLAADIAAENRCYDVLPRDQVVLASHLCRGNRVSWGGGRGSYDAVAEQLFNELHVDRFLLEYDTERAGGFEPLRFLPRDKVVVLGLVTTKSRELERREDLLRRIDEASKYVPVEQLALSPQCGFFHAADDETMTIDEQWRKLQLVVDTAREVWGE